MDSSIKIGIFLAFSLGIGWLSRVSLRDPRSHGFYRFFAWECIFGLFLLNVGMWFVQSFSWHQVISWGLLTISLYLIVHGVLAFKHTGQHGQRAENPALIGIEKTTQLVTNGPYRFIRHPFYSSLLFLAWGIFFKHPSWAGAGLAVLVTGMLVITAKIEERENIAYFGEEYVQYMGKTKMFVPFLF